MLHGGWVGDVKVLTQGLYVEGTGLLTWLHSMPMLRWATTAMELELRAMCKQMLPLWHAYLRPCSKMAGSQAKKWLLSSQEAKQTLLLGFVILASYPTLA